MQKSLANSITWFVPTTKCILTPAMKMDHTVVGHRWLGEDDRGAPAEEGGY